MTEKTLLKVSARIHAAKLAGGREAEIDLSVREALRLIRRVNEVVKMDNKERDYFEGHIRGKSQKKRRG